MVDTKEKGKTGKRNSSPKKKLEYDSLNAKVFNDINLPNKKI